MTRDDLLALATPAQREILEVLAEHPHYNNEQIGLTLGKAVRTIDNQLLAFYKLCPELRNLPATTKRNILRDWLRGIRQI